MNESIQSLSDVEAERLLNAVTRPRLRKGDVETEATPELRRALREAFADGAEADRGGSEAALRGDLARDALRLLADDPETRPALEAMLQNPIPAAFAGPLTTAALVTLVLVALQTEVKFHRKADGSYTLQVHLRPSSDDLLKPLVQKLLALFSRTPS